MTAYSGVYVARMSAVSVSTAITLVQVKAGTTCGLEIIRAWVGNTDSETSNQLQVQFLRKTAAATVTSFTPLKFGTNMAAANAAGGTSATGHTATVEGTDGDILIADGFNVLNGWLYVPTPEERPQVPVSGIVAIKLGSAPAAATVLSAGIVFGETG